MNSPHSRTFVLLAACALGALSPNVPLAASATAVKASTTLKNTTKLVTFGSVPVLSTEGSLVLAARFSKSMKSRRDFAWKVVAKVFEPVDVSSSAYTGKLPLWHTWYEEDDFRDVYAALLKSKTSLRTPTLATQVSKVDVAAAIKATSVKNLDRSISSANLGKQLRQFTRVAGLGTNANPAPGTGMVLYSPTMVEHMLKSAGRMVACDPSQYPADKKPSKLDPQSLRPSDKDNRWAMCMMHEFPKDGIMIKTRWEKIAGGIKAYGTSATDLATMWSASSAGTFAASETTKPDASTMYTLTDETGAVWGLEGMHIATKDIQLWTWISLWWSKPSVKDSDFGSDRPSSVYAQWPALANYKMCITTDYEEKDSDPASYYRGSDKTKSLGDAFDKLKGLSGGAQWCANPYLETSFAKTNCIGCHQGAGVNFDITAVKKNRENGIPDFVYGFDAIKAAMVAENAKK